MGEQQGLEIQVCSCLLKEMCNILKILQNDWFKTQWDFQTDKQVDQTVVVDTQRKEAVVIDIAVPNNRTSGIIMGSTQRGESNSGPCNTLSCDP